MEMINVKINGVMIPVKAEDIDIQGMETHVVDTYIEEQKDELVKELILNCADAYIDNLESDFDEDELFEAAHETYDAVYNAITLNIFPYVVDNYKAKVEEIVTSYLDSYIEEHSEKYYSVTVEVTVRHQIAVKARSQEEADKAVEEDFDAYKLLSDIDLCDADVELLYSEAGEELDAEDIYNYSCFDTYQNEI